MMIAFLPHLLGVFFLVFAVQLVRKLSLDLKGRGFAAGVMALAAGLLSLALATAVVVAVDAVLPVGGGESEATLFVRVAFLIPLLYLSALASSTVVGRMIGPAYPQTAVFHATCLGATLLILSPILKSWIQLLSS